MWPFRRKPAVVEAPPPMAAAAAPVGSRAPGGARPFTPTQPRQGRAGLVGRGAELTRILQAIGEDRAHVVIYSERGRGKTSLANAVVEGLRQGGTAIARYSCAAESEFDDIVRGLVAALPAGVLPEGGAAAVLPAHPLRPEDVAALLPQLRCRSLVCVVDEFDRVADQTTAGRMADTIKRLSDRGVALQFLIVGVSENLEQILGQHPSIQRNIVAVQLPLLTDAEVGEVIGGGMGRAGIGLPAELGARLVLLSRGSPHMAQLLGLRLVQAVGARGADAVTETDLVAALDQLLREGAPRDAALWEGLTENGRNSEMVTALRRLATAEQDRWGRIEIQNKADGGVVVAGRTIAAEVWGRVMQAGLLRAVPEGSGLYVFRHRSAMHHILLLATRRLSAVPHSVRLVAGGA